MIKSLSSIISFTLILVQSSSFAAQNRGNVTVGESLKATSESNASSWLSPSGDFAFGFHQFNNNSDLFLLAIWYANIPDTIVWYANGGKPVSQGSTVSVTANEGLVLSDSQGSRLWDTSSGLNGASVSYGFMNDTGNFALKSNSGRDPVWESFGYPTDTLLPTQTLEIGFEVDSRLSKTNFTKGRFQFRLIPDGNLVLNTKDIATNYAYGAYYVSGTNDPSTNAGQKLIYNESGYMYILRMNSSRYDLLPQEKAASAKDYYQRATLNFDGVLTWYSIPRSTSSSNGWSAIQSLPDNICVTVGSPGPDLGSGICGYNSICSLGDDQRPRCNCPLNYTPLDDMYGSCKPDFKLDDCEGQGMKGKYTLLPLPNTDWPFNDYARFDPSTEEDCKTSCLNDCFCAAALFQDTTDALYTGCWLKKAPLSNGRRDSKVSGIAWLKVGNVNVNDTFNSSFPHSTKVKNKLNTVISVMLGGSVFVNFFLISAIGLGIFFIYRKKPIKRFDGGRSKILTEYSNVHCFSYQELKEATNGFKEELGRGAFGIVYKGVINVGGPLISIAVKKLDRICSDADKEFKTEVNVIGQTHHKNLVRLVGFCKEKDQRLLVYEYMSNGSLADYLFGNLRPSWITRIQIAIEIAGGLLYLHDECRTQIIHCDIKPQNILLDDKNIAYISDFGLAKLLVLNQSKTYTGIRGTKGYIAPEWFRNKPVTVKVDVYGFGVLLLEIISCRRSVCTETIGDDEGAILTDWAIDCYQYGKLDSLVNNDMEALNDRLRLEMFVMVALWCIQEDPSLRPTMRLVVQMLQGHAQVPTPPCPPSFSVSTQY